MQLLWKLNCYQIFPSTICIARQIWNPENASKQSDKHVVFQYWHKRGKTVKREVLKVSFVISQWILSDTDALWENTMGQKRPKCPDKFVLLLWSNYGPPTAECWICPWHWMGLIRGPAPPHQICLPQNHQGRQCMKTLFEIFLFCFAPTPLASSVTRCKSQLEILKSLQHI